MNGCFRMIHNASANVCITFISLHVCLDNDNAVVLVYLSWFHLGISEIEMNRSKRINTFALQKTLSIIFTLIPTFVLLNT